jgi:hypothetical protein
MLQGQKGTALVRGRVAELQESPILPPEDVRLPAGAPELAQAAVALIEIERLRRFERPICIRHERVRSFWLRDSTGRALIRFTAAARGDLDLHLRRPFVQSEDGDGDVYLRTVGVGEELVVAACCITRSRRQGRWAPTVRLPPWP